MEELNFYGQYSYVTMSVEVEVTFGVGALHLQKRGYPTLMRKAIESGALLSEALSH